MFSQLSLLLKITRSRQIVRRYFIVNGFDGALTMLGIIVGFYLSIRPDLDVILNACFGAAIALGMSGLTSAYISESAEQEKQLRELEQAMVDNLDDSAFGRAARRIPLLIAMVNGLSPLLICLLIISPIWLADDSSPLPIDPLKLSLFIAFGVLFLFGVFLGRVSGRYWLWAGVRTLLIAATTVALIYLLTSF